MAIDVNITTSFTGNTDTPNDYTGEKGKVVAVNNDEDGLEFIDATINVDTITIDYNNNNELSIVGMPSGVVDGVTVGINYLGQLEVIGGGGDTNVQSDWNESDNTSDSYIKNKPTLFSGNYNDLSNKPTLFSGNYNDLSNKPTIPTNNNQLTNGAGYVTTDTTYTAGSNIQINGSNVISATDTTYNDLSEFNNDVGFIKANEIPVDGVTIHLNVNNELEVIGGGGDTNVQSDWNQTDNTEDDYIKNKPTLFSGNYNDLTNKPTIPTSNSQLVNDENYITINDVQQTLVDGITIDYNSNDELTVLVSDTTYSAGNGINIDGSNEISIDLTLDLSDFTNDLDISDFTDSTNLLFSGNYNDLTNKPTIPTNNNQLTNGAGYVTTDTTYTADDGINIDGSNKIKAKVDGTTVGINHLGQLEVIDGGGDTNVQSDWNQTNNTEDDYIKNKPTLFSGNYNDLTNKPTNLSNFTNGPGFITSSALNGYATETYVNNIVNTEDFKIIPTYISTTINNSNSGKYHIIYDGATIVISGVADAYDTGFRIDGFAYNQDFNISKGSGVTIISDGGNTTVTRNTGFTLICINGSTKEFILIGKLK